MHLSDFWIDGVSKPDRTSQPEWAVVDRCGVSLMSAERVKPDWQLTENLHILSNDTVQEVITHLEIQCKWLSDKYTRKGTNIHTYCEMLWSLTKLCPTPEVFRSNIITLVTKLVMVKVYLHNILGEVHFQHCGSPGQVKLFGGCNIKPFKEGREERELNDSPNRTLFQSGSLLIGCSALKHRHFILLPSFNKSIQPDLRSRAPVRAKAKINK